MYPFDFLLKKKIDAKTTDTLGNIAFAKGFYL